MIFRRQVEPWAAPVDGGLFPAAGGFLDVCIPTWRAEPVRLRLPSDERWIGHRRQARALLVANGLNLDATQGEAVFFAEELAEGRLPADLPPRLAPVLIGTLERFEVLDLEAESAVRVVMAGRAAGVNVSIVFRVPPPVELEEMWRTALDAESSVRSFDALVLGCSGYAAGVPPVFHKATAGLEVLKSLWAVFCEARQQR